MSFPNSDSSFLVSCRSIFPVYARSTKLYLCERKSLYIKHMGFGKRNRFYDSANKAAEGVPRLKEQYATETHSVHGLINDMDFRDTRYRPYFWHKVEPREMADYNFFRRGSMCRSLRELAAETVARHRDQLTPAILGYGSWDNLWQHVWEQICSNGHDSFELFSLFCAKFGDQKTFVVANHSGRKTKSRQQVYKVKIPCNASWSQLVPLISFNSNIITLLDLRAGSSCILTESICRGILGLPNLAALDISDSRSVPAGTLLAWKIAMESGNLRCLRLLCLGENVAPSQLGQYFSVPTLTYLEGRAVEKSPGTWTEGSNIAERLFTNHNVGKGGSQVASITDVLKLSLSSKYRLINHWQKSLPANNDRDDEFSSLTKKRVVLDISLDCRDDNLTQKRGRRTLTFYVRTESKNEQKFSKHSPELSVVLKKRKRAPRLDSNGNFI